jgi:hypothetical protein
MGEKRMGWNMSCIVAQLAVSRVSTGSVEPVRRIESDTIEGEALILLA